MDSFEYLTKMRQNKKVNAAFVFDIIDGKDMVVLCVNSSSIVDPQTLAMEGAHVCVCVAWSII